MLCILTLKKILLVLCVMSSQQTREVESKWKNQKVKTNYLGGHSVIVHSSLSSWKAVSRIFLQLSVQLQVGRHCQSGGRQAQSSKLFWLEKWYRMNFRRNNCKVKSLGRNNWPCKGRQGNSQAACPWKWTCKLLRIKPEVNIITLMQIREKIYQGVSAGLV